MPDGYYVDFDSPIYGIDPQWFMSPSLIIDWIKPLVIPAIIILALVLIAGFIVYKNFKEYERLNELERERERAMIYADAFRYVLREELELYKESN